MIITDSVTLSYFGGPADGGKRIVSRRKLIKHRETFCCDRILQLASLTEHGQIGLYESEPHDLADLSLVASIQLTFVAFCQEMEELEET